MRIGFVTDQYMPYVSGVTHSISLNRRYLEKHGHETYIFHFAHPDAEPVEHRTITSPGFKLAGTSGFRVGPRLTREARRVLSTMDVVNLDDPFLSGRMALPVCKRNGIPIVFTNHTRVDLYAEYYAKMLPSILHDRPLRWYMRNFCRDVAAVVAPTDGMAQVLLEMGVDVPIEVVPNGVDIGPFLSVPRGIGAAQMAHGAMRTDLGLHAGDAVFAYSGRLGPEKNLTLLIDAFARMADMAPHAQLVFIGGGPQRRRIESAVVRARLTERVRFTGMVPYEMIPRYLAPCDVWVSPSVTEVHPLTVIEAMAAGLPIIGVESPGVSDTVRHGVTGLLATTPDASALAECLLALAVDPRRRHDMGLAAREDAKRYAIDSTGAQMLGIYELLVSEAARRRAETGLEPPAGASSAMVQASMSAVRLSASKVRATAAKVKGVPPKVKATVRTTASRVRRSASSVRGSRPPGAPDNPK